MNPQLRDAMATGTRSRERFEYIHVRSISDILSSIAPRAGTGPHRSDRALVTIYVTPKERSD
ncbi:MAG: hypothetical protein AAF525_07265 [Pseudomonadota bacterium]